MGPKLTLSDKIKSKHFPLLNSVANGLEKGIWCRTIQPKFIGSDVTCKKLAEVNGNNSCLAVCGGVLPLTSPYISTCGYWFPFTGAAMAGDNTKSPGLVALQLLKRHPCFQWAEHTEFWSSDTCFCRPLCKWRPRLAVLQQWLETAWPERVVGCRASSLLPFVECLDLQPWWTRCCGGLTVVVGTLPWWAPCCGGNSAMVGTLLWWACVGPCCRRASATSPSGFATHTECSAAPTSTGGWWTLLKAAGRASHNALATGDHILRVILWLLHRPGLEKQICCYRWYNYWSQQAGVSSLLMCFIALHKEVTHGASSFPLNWNLPVPMGAEQLPGWILHGHGQELTRTRLHTLPRPPSPVKCDGMLTCWQAGGTGGNWSQIVSSRQCLPG